jgi:cytochrome P450
MVETVTDRESSEVDLTDADVYRHGFPHDIFTTLRREAPVRWQAFPEDFPGDHDVGFWVLSRHDDVQTVSREPDLFSAYDGPSLSHEYEIRGNMLVSMDGRDHVRQRRLINAGFTPRMVRQLDENTRSWAVSIIDNALELGTCDFVRDVAYQLPMHVIADIVGIPVEDRAWLFALTTDLLVPRAEHPLTPEEHVRIQVQMFEYAQQLGQAKRFEPKDDVWTILSTVEVEDDEGNRTALNEIELDLFFLLLTVAGSETTRNSLSLGLLTLLNHPDQLGALRQEPEAIPVAVEEILRWSSPVSYFARRATRATEIRGVPIAEGDRVTMWYPSANRDEAVFDDPFRFNIRRSPNPHVAFSGGGAHFCLGANLARREMIVLFEELLARTREIEALGPPTYAALGIYNPILLAMRALPVHLA